MDFCKQLFVLLLAGALLAPTSLFSQETSSTPKSRAAARADAAAAAAIPPSAYNAHPKLAIILVIDQFREDYLERYRADFKGHGFKLFLDKGAYFPDCYYDYANTKTAPATRRSVRVPIPTATASRITIGGT